MHICFVCTGNICRSPMAALVFGEHLRRAGLADRVRVSSAGTDGWHVGEAADPRTARVLARHGYPTSHVAAQVGADHLDADLLVAMDSGHARALRSRVPDPERVTLFRVFDPGAETDLDIPDPYYGGPDGFDQVLAMVEAACPGLVRWVQEN
ncbi:protein-tyrosine phosphatase [Actinokineospora baliensis]|uniref:low molecular weight protein-tyrosine-phosphatase n=1 Tax=Actinokineospora baliensis TaxID=547056 RepID=UPI0019583E79|nr:low molecular weight protein-tyrosine-phosphatase [Actinokineospora baliensis]MBM7772148.1 protein-tyrosine phosphatase [Actinokineospora baliensis]